METQGLVRLLRLELECNHYASPSSEFSFCLLLFLRGSCGFWTSSTSSARRGGVTDHPLGDRKHHRFGSRRNMTAETHSGPRAGEVD